MKTVLIADPRKVFTAGMVSFPALCAGLLAGQMLAYTIEPKWGEPVNSLRMGIAADMTSPESDSRLVVLFENTGPSNLTVLVGAAESGNLQDYNFHLRAKDANGSVCEVLDFSGGASVVGYRPLSPVIISLAPGKTHEIELPMSKLICVENRTDYTLDSLLRRQFTVSASFKADAQGAAWANLSHPWLGVIRSGDLASPVPSVGQSPAYNGNLDEHCTVQRECDALGCSGRALITYEGRVNIRTEVVPFPGASIWYPGSAPLLLKMGQEGWQPDGVSFDIQTGVVYHLKRRTFTVTRG